MKAGADPRRIVFSGVGKTLQEIDLALKKRILQFNVESPLELKMLEARARALGQSTRASVRLNPDVDPKTHPYIATGLREHKFGVDTRFLGEMFQLSRTFRRVRLEGLGFHIGSQLLSVKPYVDAAKILAGHVRELRSGGFAINSLDLGGGLGIPYRGERGPSARDLAQGVLPVLRPLKCELLFEPGRWLVGRAGALVTQVLFVKQNGQKRFVVVDAGMNDLIRPSLYGAYHEIMPVQTRLLKRRVRVDVVGPICETGDFFARDRLIETVGEGGLLAIRDAGAYGFTLSSNYNAHPRCPEILVAGSRWEVIRRRERMDDLIRGE